jgi:dolichol-phosphate mannosyltransferase
MAALAMPMISIIIPAKNEAPNLVALLDEIEVALDGRKFEIIVVDDGSTDDTEELMQRQKQLRSLPLRYIRHEHSSGQSLALRSGVFAARGELIATLDGDGQNDPAFILELVDALHVAGPDAAIAVGQRVNRKHTFVKNVASHFANQLRNAVLHDNTRDSACGLKVVRTEVFRKLPFFDGCHRFLPALVMQERFRVVHVDVVDRPRLHGKSNYGIVDRGLRGALDLLGVWWLRRRRRSMPTPKEM